MKNFIIGILIGIVIYQHSSTRNGASEVITNKSDQSLKLYDESKNIDGFPLAELRGISSTSQRGSTFQKYLDKELSQKGISAVVFSFLATHDKKDPQTSLYFKSIADWMRTNLTKSDHYLWQTFANEWIKSDKESAREYLFHKNNNDEFSIELNAMLNTADVQENYAPFLSKMLSSGEPSVDYFTATSVLEEAYRERGLGLRSDILSSKKNLPKQTVEDYLTAFYGNLWESEVSGSSPLIGKLLESEDMQEGEVALMLSTGYLKNHDEYLEWFKENAPQLAKLNFASQFYESYQRMNDADKLWLSQFDNFKNFDALMVSTNSVHP